ncbi:unnamed protein product [Prunus armeniaca]
MLGGNTLPYLVLHSGGSRRKLLCLRTHSLEIAYTATMHSPKIASHKLRLLSKNLKYLLLPPLPSIYRTSLASETETSQVFAALLTRGTHAQGSPTALTSPLAPTLRTFHLLPFFPFLRQSPTFTAYGRHARVEFSLTSRAERQARTGRVFHSPLVPNGRHALVEFSLTSRAERQARTSRCQTAGTHWSSFHSPLLPNGRHARVKFSLTSRAERLPRTGQVFTHLLCRTAGVRGRVFHSPLPTDSLPFFIPTSRLGDLGDYMIIIGLQTTDAHSRVRVLELRDKQVPNQEVPPRSKTWGTTAIPNVHSVCSIDSWGRLCTIGPFANLQHGMPSNQPSRQSISVRLPQNFCWNLSEHVSISGDTPPSPTSKLSAKSITNALYK